VSGHQLLTLEALLHAASSLCSGEGAKALNFFPVSNLPPGITNPEILPQILTSRNMETSNMLYSFLSDLFQLALDLMKPPTPLFAYASPLLRLLVVLVTDLYTPLLTHFAAGDGTAQHSEFEELCCFTKSCCELLLQTVYLSEEFNVDTAHVVASGPQICFIGALLPFRVKQDHIGCVSLIKMSQLINKLSVQPSTRSIMQHLSAIVSGQPVNVILPHLLCHFPQDETLACNSIAYSSHLYTDVLSHAYDVHGIREESTNDVVLLWIKTFLHHMISFAEVKNGKVSSPR
jgi:hypothetical protein